MNLRWWARRRASGQGGSVPIELAMGIGVLVLPIALLVSVLPTWAERQSMARLAVREAARAAALADDALLAEAQGSALAMQIAANHGVPPSELRALRVTVPRDGGGRPLRGGEVEAAVEVLIPLTAIPLLGPAGGWWWGTEHRETIDAYRSLPAP